MLDIEWNEGRGKFRLNKGGVYFFLTEAEIVQIMAALREKCKNDSSC